MELDRVVSELASVGLDEDEARLYVHLLRGGTAKASTLSSMSRFSRSKVYRLLEDLVDQGYVRAKLEQPTYYAPLPPDELFDRIRSDWRRGLEQTDRIEERLRPVLDRYRDGDTDGYDPSWRIVQGRLSILDELQSLVDEAEEIKGIGRTYTEGALQPPLGASWGQAADRCRAGDLDLRAVLSGPEDHVRSRVDVDGGSALRVRRTGRDVPGLCVLCDDDVVLTTLNTRPESGVRSRDDVALLTDARDQIRWADMLFQTLWSQAEPLD